MITDVSRDLQPGHLICTTTSSLLMRILLKINLISDTRGLPIQYYEECLISTELKRQRDNPLDLLIVIREYFPHE